MPINDTVKLIAALLLGCALLFAGQTILEWREGAQQNEQRGQTMHAASGIVKDGSDSSAARVDADAGIEQARDAYEQSTEEDRQREPQTATRDTGAVPASRLRAFEQRRIARERLANDRLRRAGVERPEGLGPEEAPER